MTTIGENAFDNCNSLESITLPDSLTTIRNYAFDDCTALTSVYYNGTAEDWSNISIGSNNYKLSNAGIVYYFSNTQPTESGNYWHYVDGEIVVWTQQS